MNTTAATIESAPRRRPLRAASALLVLSSLLVAGGRQEAEAQEFDTLSQGREVAAQLAAGETEALWKRILSSIEPDVVYASIELAGRKGGFWRSANAGASWRPMRPKGFARNVS